MLFVTSVAKDDFSVISSLWKRNDVMCEKLQGLQLSLEVQGEKMSLSKAVESLDHAKCAQCQLIVHPVKLGSLLCDWCLSAPQEGRLHPYFCKQHPFIVKTRFMAVKDWYEVQCKCHMFTER